MTDGIRDLASEHEARPARQSVAARQRKLGINERCRLGGGTRRVERGEVGYRVDVTPVNGAEQILGLASELTQVGMHGKMTVGHGLPPWECPMSAGDGRKEARENRSSLRAGQVDSALSADGRRPARRRDVIRGDSEGQG